MPPPGSMTVRNKAVELKVEGVERVPRIGDRAARPGYEFVIVDTSWKNIIPLTLVDKSAAQNPTGGFNGFGGSKKAADPANQTLEPTLFAIPMLKKQMWLLTDDRYADTVDLEAQPSVPDHLPPGGFAIAKLDDVVRGKVVFEAPAGAKYQAFQFYDNDHGHELVPLMGSRPSAPAPTTGALRQNALIQGALTEARFLPSDTPSPAGQRPYVVGIRGVSRSPTDIVEVPMRFLFAQTDQGCLASPEPDPKGLTRPFGANASFIPTGANEGQLLFYVPAGTRAVRLLVRAQNGGPLDLPAGADFQPSWPAPVRTIADGATARVLVLPTPGPPEGLPAPPNGRAWQLLDVVIENVNPSKGVELQLVQLRLVARDGSFTDPSPVSAQVPCRLSAEGVIPAATARRFMLVYDIPPDERPRRLEYRGFEVDAVTVDLP